MALPIIQDLIKGGISGIGDAFSNIVSKFKADPTKVAELDSDIAQAKIAADLKVQELANQIEDVYAKELETVNQTMREESKSEHFLVWGWRPIIGFTFCAVILNNYILLPYFKKYGAQPIDIPENVWYSILTILGVASAGRSVTKWQATKNKQ